jgi:hypothetical protein
MIGRAISLMSVAAIACLVLGATSPAHATTVIVEFSNFTPGDSFSNASLPTTIVADGVDVELTKYNNSNFANASIWNLPIGGADSNGLFLAANIRAEIPLSALASGGEFYFQDFGGDNFLEINGELLSFVDSALAGADTHSVGGVSVHSAGVIGGARSATLEGPITTIAFIGQELLIDGVHLTLVPEPSTWALMVLGAISMFALVGRQP